jgi:hypothetical protein
LLILNCIESKTVLLTLVLLAFKGVVVESQAHSAIIALEAMSVEEDALRCLSLHNVHALLAEIAELAGWLGR